MRVTLVPIPFVDAFFEGGAAAWGRIDAWSDIDLQVIVEDGRAGEAFLLIEAALSTISTIERTFVAAWPPSSGIEQKFYRLERAGPYLLVDLAVVERSAPDKFFEPEIHGRNLVYFDKTGVTSVPPLDRRAFEERRRARLARLVEQTEIFHVFVKKEANRKNWIEAIDNYRAYVLNPLIEVLRMKHGPLHHTFRTRYVHHELPPDVVHGVQRLLFVKDETDLMEKYDEAVRWFREVAAELG